MALHKIFEETNSSLHIGIGGWGECLLMMGVAKLVIKEKMGNFGVCESETNFCS
jgi:hypothetical protein